MFVCFSECVALQDPYCAWDKQGQRCRAVGAPRWNDEKIFYQSIATGSHPDCPRGEFLFLNEIYSNIRMYYNYL